MIHRVAFAVLIIATISTMGLWDDSPVATIIVIVSAVGLWGLICWHAWWNGRRGSPTCVCLRCDYNLTGNVSGRCPECGLEVPSMVSSDHSFALDPGRLTANDASPR